MKFRILAFSMAAIVLFGSVAVQALKMPQALSPIARP